MERAWTPLVVPPRLSGPVLDSLLRSLVDLDEAFLRENPRTPWLYYAGLRYIREPVGEEKWLSIPAVLAQGGGDCEDLAAYRCAELRVRGDMFLDPFLNWQRRSPPERAVAFWTLQPNRSGSGRLYHIRVRRADGRIEDPSAVLGMGASAWGAQHTIVDGERS